MIVGQNGAGKSTMLDAISYGLFGKSHRNINKAQLVNSVNEKKMVVEVEFSIGTKEYKVVRGLKPVKFEIYVDGTMVNQNSHNKEYQKILEQNILKFNHKTFHQVVVLGSSSFIPFMQLSALNRRDVIEDLLDINVFSKMNMILKQKSAALKEKVNQVYHQIEINETKTEAQKKYLRDISKLNNDFKKNKEEEITLAESEIKEINSDVETKQAEANALREEFTPKMEKVRGELDQLNGFERDFTTQIKSLVKEAKFYENNEACPTCEQTIEPELKEQKLSDSKSKASELQSGLTQVKSKRESTTARMTDFQAELDKMSEMLSDVQVGLSSIGLKNGIINKARAEIDELSNNHSDLAKANEEFDALMSSHHELLGERNSLNDQSAYNQVISEMLKDTGIKTKIIKQYLPVINKLVNQYLQILDFYVYFNLDGSFNETIKSRHRDAFSYASFSEGEKQRIDLSLLFTWRQIAKMKNSISTNLLILDETFDSSLDEAGIDNLLKIIRTLGDDTNVFIISHKGEILDGKFSAKIEFVKEKNFSKAKVQ